MELHISQSQSQRRLGPVKHLCGDSRKLMNGKLQIILLVNWKLHCDRLKLTFIMENLTLIQIFAKGAIY
jgi:hypothetical protein